MSVAILNDSQFNHIIGRYKKLFNDSFSFLFATKKGLKPDAVFDFMSVSRLPGNDIEYLLNKTIKTFNSYKINKTNLDATTSEKLLKLFGLYDKGILIFGSTDEFNKWLRLVAAGLGGQVPLLLLDTITGIEKVSEELVRIEYGDLA